MSDVPGEQPAQVPQPVVMKFGGTSLADAAAIRRAIRIVKPRLAHNPVVVASALADVTDQLLAAGQSAAKGQAASAAASLQYLQRRHEQVALDAAGSEAFESLRPQLASEFEQLHRLLPAISTFGELTRQLQDQFIGAGECLSSRIVQAAFLQDGVDAVWLEMRASASSPMPPTPRPRPYGTRPTSVYVM